MSNAISLRAATLRRTLRGAAGIAGVALAVGATPALASIQPLRQSLTPRLLPARLSGLSSLPHLALTFDDGPDPSSTPHFLALLAESDVRATFFLLADQAGRHRGLVREMVAAGHEIGLHGWDHTCTARLTPGALRQRTSTAKHHLEEVSGRPLQWYRPPYGVLTTPTLAAARHSSLRLVLWTAWGRDWEAKATPDSIVRTVHRGLRPGGCLLLHDTDRTSANGSWRHTLDATRRLLDEWQGARARVGPLAEHWPATPVLLERARDSHDAAVTRGDAEPIGPPKILAPRRSG